MKRHRWGPKQRFAHKTEWQCQDCAIVKAVHHQFENGCDVYWTEFWNGFDRIECEGTPACEPSLCAEQNA